MEGCGTEIKPHLFKNQKTLGFTFFNLRSLSVVQVFVLIFIENL